MTDSREILLRLPWPPTKTSPNKKRSGNWREKSEAAKKYKADCTKECWARAIRKLDYSRAHVELTFYPPTAHAFDLDNVCARAKQGLDAVAEAIGIDDSRWDRLTLIRGEKTAGGCILVHIMNAESALVDVPFEGTVM